MRKICNAFAVAVGVLTCWAVTARAEWAPVQGLYGGNIRALATDGAAVFAGTGKGVYRSLDNGSTWTRTGDGVTPPHITSLAINSSTVLAGSRTEGIYRSTDYGVSWTVSNTGLVSPVVYSLVAKGDLFFAGSDNGGIYRSANGGLSWEKLNIGTYSRSVKPLIVKDGSIIANVSLDGLIISHDDGDTWALISNGLPCPECGISALGVYDGELVAAVTLDDVYEYDDNSGTWTATGFPMTWARSMATSGDELYVAGNDLMYRYNSTGWDIVSFDVPLYPSNLVSCNGRLAIGTDWHGVFLSADSAKTWVPSNQGLDNVYVFTVLVHEEHIFIANEGIGVMLSEDTLQHLSKVSDKIFKKMIKIPGGSNDWYLATSSDGIYRSGTAGRTWGRVSDVYDAYGTSSLVTIDSVAFAGSSSSGVIRSSDFGETWMSVNTGLLGSYVSALGTMNGELYATTMNGVFRSSNLGESWTHVSDDIVASGTRVLISRGDRLYAGTDNGVWVSSNHGTTWRNDDAGIGNPHILTMTVRGSHVIASDNAGKVYVSGANGSSWRTVSAGLPNIAVTSLAATPDYLLAGTEGRSVWACPWSDVFCCNGLAGNVNLNGTVDLSDLSSLVSYLTGGAFVLPCYDAANLNGAGLVDLTDLSLLVGYLTGGGQSLNACL